MVNTSNVVMLISSIACRNGATWQGLTHLNEMHSDAMQLTSLCKRDKIQLAQCFATTLMIFLASLYSDACGESNHFMNHHHKPSSPLIRQCSKDSQMYHYHNVCIQANTMAVAAPNTRGDNVCNIGIRLKIYKTLKGFILGGVVVCLCIGVG